MPMRRFWFFHNCFFQVPDATMATLESLATFSIAFLSRPLGSAFFGHYGDKIGRKFTLVAALLTMGISTVAIGFLPSYASIGVAAPLLLMLVSIWTRCWFRRRMGRSCFVGNRKCTAK